jgi:hypothetical protein
MGRNADRPPCVATVSVSSTSVQDDRIHLARSRHANAAFVLPVLEDANSIQDALMQVMRLAASQQIEHKTASFSPLCPANRQQYLRLTASRPASTTSSSIRAMAAKLRSTPASGRMMMLTTTKEDVEVAKPDPVAAFAEQFRQEKLEKARKRRENGESLKRWVAEHPQYRLVTDDDGRLRAEFIPREPEAEMPAVRTTAEDIRAHISHMVRSNLSELTEAIAAR